MFTYEFTVAGVVWQVRATSEDHARLLIQQTLPKSDVDYASFILIEEASNGC